MLELAGTPSRDTVAAALSNGSCVLFNSGGPTLETAGECMGHKSPVTSLLISPDAPDLLLSASDDATVRAWDLRSRQQIQQCVVPSPCAFFRPALLMHARILQPISMHVVGWGPPLVAAQ